METIKILSKTAVVVAALMAATAYQPASAFTFKAPPIIQQADGIVLEVGKKQRRRNRALAAGAAIGLLGAAIISNQNRRRNYDDDDDDVEEVEYERPRRRRSGGSWRRHVERCYDAYKSYNERTDTYVSYSGEVRRCRK